MVVVEVVVFPFVVAWCVLEPLEDLVAAPKATIRHPSEVLTNSTGRSDAVWPLAPDRVMAEALDPWTVTDPTASVG